MTAREPDASKPPSPQRLRWAIYTVLIAVSIGQATGRLMAVNAVDTVRLERYRIEQRLAEFRQELASRDDLSEPARVERVAKRRAELEQKLRLQRPFLSANDRSRWMAIRALVEHGTFAIDTISGQPTWDTIDMVQHRGADGEPHLYSSKPPLLYVLIAGEYWLIHKATGMTLGTHPYVVGRAMLLTINLLPLALLLVMVAALAERLCATDWGRVFIVAAASFGTMLSTFAVVLNNHLPAAVAASVAVYAWARVRVDGDHRRRWFALAGLAAAFTAANELPALALLVFLGLGLLVRHPRPTLAWFTPAALLVVVAFFGTNWIAHQSLRPPYMHRDADQPGTSASGNDDWYHYEFTVNGKTRQSYWSNRQGIDVGEPSRRDYALHCLVGHHGVFSLTPVWVLSVAGAAAWILIGPSARRELGVIVLSLTIICLVFYIGLRPQQDRNYGGHTSGLRWMFWFAPLWLATMAPAVDRLARSRIGQAFALTLLAASCFSASYPTWNPWTHPWIWHWLQWGA